MAPIRKQASQFTERSMYCPGDILRIQVPFDAPKLHRFLWLSVDRCDDRHEILFGTITSAPSGVGKALSCGAKLGVAYHLVLENASIVRHAGSRG